MVSSEMSAGTGENKVRVIVINVLAVTGALLYLILQCGAPLLHMPRQDEVLKSVALSITMITQISRGLLWHLDLRRVPGWLVLSKLDRRLAADSTVVFVIAWLILEAAFRNSIVVRPEPPYVDWFSPVSTLFAGIQFILGGWLVMLSLRRTNTNVGLALAAMLVFMLVFLSPLLLVAGVAYGLYHFLQLQSDRDTEVLIASAIVPITIAVIMLSFKDRRDRGKNTNAVIWTQILALPAVPLCFFALRAFWPQQISAMLFPVVLLAPVILVMVPIRLFGPKRAWLVKEKVEILQQEVTADCDASLSKAKNRESQMAEIRRELAENRLKLKTANDHIDRADAFWKLGDLYSELSKLDDAEESYNCAVKSYNDALQIDPDNRTAIANKFKTVEAVSELKRRRYS